jgi:hypothetical protein
MTPQSYDPVALARQFAFVRESGGDGSNHGLRVNAIQLWGGGMDGQSWCAWFATMILDIAFQGAAPIPREGSCENIRELAARNGWIAPVPRLGDLVLSIDPAADVAHHVGIVSKVDPLMSIAGNTSEDGTSSNGDRVAEHVIDPTNKLFVHYPR